MQPTDKIIAPKDWWRENAGFFGAGYMRGDNSLVGYLPSRPENLEERTQRETEGIIKLLELNGGDRLIDVPCGYGRHVIELARQGIQCTGVDINDEHLSRAKELDAHLQVQFVQADMRSFASELEPHYDAVTNMFFSFGFFATDEENQAVLQQFHSVLKPGGRCLIHTDVSPEMITNGHYRKVEERALFQATLKIHEHYDEASGRLLGTWSISDSAGEISLTPYSVRIYTAEELTQLLQKSHFRNVRCLGGFDGRSFDATSEELIIIGEK